MRKITIPYLDPFDIVFGGTEAPEISTTIKTKTRTIDSIEKKIDQITKLYHDFFCKHPEIYQDFFVIVPEWDYNFYKEYQIYYIEQYHLSRYQILPPPMERFKTDKPGLILPNNIRVLPGNVKKPVIGWEP